MDGLLLKVLALLSTGDTDRKYDKMKYSVIPRPFINILLYETQSDHTLPLT